MFEILKDIKLIKNVAYWRSRKNTQENLLFNLIK